MTMFLKMVRILVTADIPAAAYAIGTKETVANVKRREDHSAFVHRRSLNHEEATKRNREQNEREEE